MYKEHDVNGIIYTDGEECVWYELKNNSFKKLMDKDVFLRNQSKKGGQSANRIARNRDIQRDQFIQLMAEQTIKLFYDKMESYQKVVNIVFCGPAEFKGELAANRLITSFFQEYSCNYRRKNGL